MAAKGTIPRLEPFKEDIFKEIDEYGGSEPTYNEGTLQSYVTEMRMDTKMKVMEHHIILLTLMKRTASPAGET